jgi:hypothetical protein
MPQTVLAGTVRYKGKEGFKTIMYNMSVAHDGRIYNIAGPHAAD